MSSNRYEDRINRAIALIDREIDRDLSIKRLADEACLSPFHFHRLFSILTGESVHKLTTRIRMQRALALTHKGSRPQWKQIAGAVGYRSADAFARAFKRHYGCSPSQFDIERWWQDRPDRDAALSVSQYFLRPAPPLPTDFKVELTRRPAASVMISRAVGGYVDPASMIAAYERLRDAALDLKIPLANRLSGASRDDPELVPLAHCRYDFALEVEATVSTPKGFLRTTRAEGLWATTHVAGDLSQVDRAWNLLFKSWLPQSGRDLRADPAEEIYHETPETIGWDRFDLTLAIPLED